MENKKKNIRTRRCSCCKQIKPLNVDYYYKLNRGFAVNCKNCYQTHNGSYVRIKKHSRSKRIQINTLIKNESCQRNIKEEFIRYMLEVCPFYFESVFHMPASYENIVSEFDKLAPPLINEEDEKEETTDEEN